MGRLILNLNIIKALAFSLHLKSRNLTCLNINIHFEHRRSLHVGSLLDNDLELYLFGLTFQEPVVPSPEN